MNKLNTQDVWVTISTMKENLCTVCEWNRDQYYPIEDVEKQSLYCFTREELEKAIGDAVQYGIERYMRFFTETVSEVKQQYIQSLLK